MTTRQMRWIAAALAVSAAFARAALTQSPAAGPAPKPRVLTGEGAFGDWTSDAPGVRRRIRPADLPAPYASRSVDNDSSVVRRPANAWPKAPAGFIVEEFQAKLAAPRLIRTAPNGDLFVAESRAGRVRVLRAAPGSGNAPMTDRWRRGWEPRCLRFPSPCRRGQAAPCG